MRALLLSLGLAATVATPVLAQDATPIADPTTQPVAEPLVTTLGQLNHPDPIEREKALLRLLDLDPSQLDALRDATAQYVEKAAPSPVLAPKLRQVVTHLVLREARERVMAQRGMLGIQNTAVRVGEDSGPVQIDRVIPGGPSFGRLQSGDLIVGIATENGSGGFSPPMRVQSFFTIYQVVVEESERGDRVLIVVQRGGQTVPVVVTLEGFVTPEVFNEAAALAEVEKRWEAQFAPLLTRQAS